MEGVCPSAVSPVMTTPKEIDELELKLKKYEELMSLALSRAPKGAVLPPGLAPAPCGPQRSSDFVARALQQTNAENSPTFDRLAKAAQGYGSCSLG